MSSALTARIAEAHASTERALPPHLAGSARRRTAMEALAAAGLPGTRDENWKYANLRPLERLSFVPARTPGAAGDCPAVADLASPIEGFSRYLFIDGAFAPHGSAPLDDTAAAFALLSREASPALQQPQGGSPDERFALLNEAFATDGASITVRGGAEPVRIELIFLAAAAAEMGASYPRVELRLEPGARLTLIERHVSAGDGASFVTSAVSAVLGHGAALEHYRLQELGSRAILFDTLSATLAAEARYRLQAFSGGAQAARSTLRLQLAGERADVMLSAASLGDRQQVQDTYALVEHRAPHAHTRQTFRGIAAGRARVAFNGKIVVAREARGTESQQSLRGLLAGPEAEIDVRPQLEIYTDEVRASHGATAGKLDDNMLFYLLSRGLDHESAQRALKWAFLGDVMSGIAVPELRRQIESRLAGQMQDAAALRELL